MKEHKRGFETYLVSGDTVQALLNDPTGAFEMWFFAQFLADTDGVFNVCSVAKQLAMSEEERNEGLGVLCNAGAVLFLGDWWCADTNWRVNNHFKISQCMDFSDRAKRLYIRSDERYTLCADEGMPLAQYREEKRWSTPKGVVRYFKQGFANEILRWLLLPDDIPRSVRRDAFRLLFSAYMDTDYFGVVNLSEVARSLSMNREREANAIRLLADNGFIRYGGGLRHILLQWFENETMKIPHTAEIPECIKPYYVAVEGTYQTSEEQKLYDCTGVSVCEYVDQKRKTKDVGGVTAVSSASANVAESVSAEADTENGVENLIELYAKEFGEVSASDRTNIIRQCQSDSHFAEVFPEVAEEAGTWYRSLKNSKQFKNHFKLIMKFYTEDFTKGAKKPKPTDRDSFDTEAFFNEAVARSYADMATKADTGTAEKNLGVSSSLDLHHFGISAKEYGNGQLLPLGRNNPKVAWSGA